MFMIVSKKSRNLIAIGNKLLKVWGMADVFDAAQAYESGRIKFNFKNRTVQLGEGRKLKCQISDVSSVVGALSLCVVKVPICSTEEEESQYQQDFMEETPDMDEIIDTPEVAPQKVEKESKSSKAESKNFDLENFLDDDYNKTEESNSKGTSIETLSRQGAVAQPENMESVLEKRETPAKKRSKSETQKVLKPNIESKEEEDEFSILKDNSEVIDLNSLLMEEEPQEHIVVDKKIKTLEPKSSEESSESVDFELDDIFDDVQESKESVAKDFNLDEILDDDLTPKESRESLDDELSIDTVIEETPAVEAKSDSDEFNLDTLFDDDVVEPKVEQTPPKEESKKTEPVPEEDFDLDALFDSEPEPKAQATPKPEPEPEPKEEEIKEVHIDFDLDDLMGESKSSEAEEPKVAKNSMDIDDIDLDALFGDEKPKETKPEPSPTPKQEEPPAPVIDTPSVEIEGEILSVKDDASIEKDIQSQPKRSPNLKWQELVSGFNIDIEENANRIEFPVEDYEELIEDFIGNSKDMENELRFGSTDSRSSAIKALKDAISMLHLHPLDELLEEMIKAGDDRDTVNSIVNSFYKILDDVQEKIQISKDKRKFASNQPTPEVTKEPEVEITLEEPSAPEPEPQQPATPAVEVLSVDEFLKDVKMIPIEFSIKLAADELNLPEDLVLEFVNDFSNQGHEYIPELIDAYQTGDLDKLQKTAHMLKGAASNLRIDPMVQNLYDLQFDNDLSRAPERIKLFAGQLMSLDQYLEQINNS